MDLSEKVRSEFPALQRYAYLDSAASALLPRSSLKVIDQYYQGLPLNAGVTLSSDIYYGGLGDEGARITTAVGEARSNVAALLHGAPDEIVFTKNTTEALVQVADGLPLTEGDEIVISDVEHQSSYLPWLRAASEKGARIRMVSSGVGGVVGARDVESLMGPRTRAVVVPHVSSLLGTVQPVAEIGQVAKSRGVPLVVDAAQSCGRLPVDVREIGCDYLAFCGHKGMLGAQGISGLWGRKEALGRLRPLTIGSRSTVMERFGDYAPGPVPYRLESGVINTEGALALGNSVGLLLAWGMDAVSKHIGALSDNLRSALRGVRDVQLYGEDGEDGRTGIVSFNLGVADSKRVAEELFAKDRVVVSPGIHGSAPALLKIGARSTLRASVHCYSNGKDIDRLIAGLKGYRRT